MHGPVLLSVLPVVVWFAAAIGVSYLVVFCLKLRLRQRKSTLTRNLLRGPGDSLRQRLAVGETKLDLYVLLLFFLPTLLAVLLMAWSKFFAAPLSPLPDSLLVLLLFVIALLGSLLFLIIRELTTGREHSFAYDSAMAVGQELNLLMRQGCGVFHDFPGDGFTVDHVLVGPSGVYAVTSEGREKPLRRHGDIEDRVFYDGRELAFPGWSETAPVDRTRHQVGWLSDWLQGVVGEPVTVKGIIFLPGWIIETNGRHEISVINEKNAAFLGRPRGKNILDAESVERVAYQIEQRCRNMVAGSIA